MTWKIVGRHKWIVNAKITESIEQTEQSHHRFTATICGWRNWKLYQGRPSQEALELVMELVQIIRDRIEHGDEGIFVFGMSHCLSVAKLRDRVEYLKWLPVQLSIAQTTVEERNMALDVNRMYAEWEREIAAPTA